MPTIMSIGGVSVFRLLLRVSAFLSGEDMRLAVLQTSGPSSSPTPSPGTHITTGNGLDPAIIAAIIALIGVVLTCAVTIAITVYQRRRTTRSEQERLASERKREEEQQQFAQKIADMTLQHEKEKILYQQEVDEQYKKRLQQEDAEAARAEVLKQNVERAQTKSERIKAYCLALQADARVARLQILDMSRPLEISNVYVRVRVHNDARLVYELDPIISRAEAQRDPSERIKASFKHLERRAISATDPDEAIRMYKRCVFVGDPGAGKTTLLKYLTLKAAGNMLPGLPGLPIRVELNKFVSSGQQDLLDFVAADWKEYYRFPQAEARMVIEEYLGEGQALLLLDALDETAIGDTTEVAEATYHRVENEILQVATRYPQAPIVVTARKAGYQQRAPLVGFTELEVLEFRLEEMQKFISNWFASYNSPAKQENGADLNAKLEHNSRIQALGANPLLLTLIVLVYEEQLNLPEKRAELYRRCVDMLLTKWDAIRTIRRRREFDPNHKKQLLAEIAWHFHLQGRRFFPTQEVLTIIAEFLPKVNLPAEKSELILAEIANEQGLIKEQARGLQGFLHLTLQEYFVAQYITDYQQLETLLAHRGDPWWEEVLILYAGYTPDASPLLQKLLGNDESKLKEDLFQTNLVLAGRCLAAQPTLHQVALWNEVIARLFASLVAAPYALTQTLIADALVAIGGANVNRQLLQLLSNDQIDANVRGRIAEALGRSGEESIAEGLVQLLANQQIKQSVRERIADSLGRSGGYLIVPFLASTQIELGVRERIARAIGFTQALDDSKEHLSLIVQKLLQLLSKNSIEPTVRAYIAEALGLLGEKTIVPNLITILSDENVDPGVRGHIALALGTLGEQSIAPHLIAMLSDKMISLEVREQIALALGTLGEQNITAQLIALLPDENVDPGVRGHIALALGTLGKRSVALELLPMLAEKRIEKRIDLSVRGYIALALGKLGEQSIASELVHLLSDGSFNIYLREYIAEAIGELGNQVVIPDLVRILPDEQVEQEVREAIAKTLGVLGKRSIASELLNMLSDESINESVRAELALTTEVLGGRSVVQELMQLSTNKDIDLFVRGRIREALRRLGKHAVGPEMEELLAGKQYSKTASERITEAVNSLEDRAPELVQLLFNKQVDIKVRGRIAEALSQLGEHSLVAELIQLLGQKHIDQDVRGQLAETLGVLVSDEANIRELAALLLESDISNQIHHALWIASRRVGVRIFLLDRVKGKMHMEIIKW